MTSTVQRAIGILASAMVVLACAPAVAQDPTAGPVIDTPKPAPKVAAPAAEHPQQPAPPATGAASPDTWVTKEKASKKAAAPADGKSKGEPAAVAASACKGLDATACSGNKACTWIVPKAAADANAKAQEPYCGKAGGSAAAKPPAKPAAEKAAGAPAKPDVAKTDGAAAPAAKVKPAAKAAPAVKTEDVAKEKAPDAVPGVAAETIPSEGTAGHAAAETAPAQPKAAAPAEKAKATHPVAAGKSAIEKKKPNAAAEPAYDPAAAEAARATEPAKAADVAQPQADPAATAGAEATADVAKKPAMKKAVPAAAGLVVVTPPDMPAR